MKKKILILFILFCNALIAKSGKVNLSGKVENKTLETIRISYLNHLELVSSKLDGNGKFEMKTNLESGFYSLEYGRNTAYIFLNPKDKIYFSFDANNFTNTLVFKGTGSIRNNYLVKKSIEEDKLTEDLDYFYRVDEEQYLKNLEKVKKSHLNLLTKYNVESFFKKAEVKSLEYERLLYIKNFKSNYKFYLGEEISVSKDFTKPIETINLKNEKDYKTQPFYRYLVNSHWNKKMDKANNVDEMLSIIRKTPSRDIAINLIESCFSKISSDKEKGEIYLNFIKKVTDHKPYIEAAEKKYKESKESEKNVKGEISPEFSYENIEGKLISLSDFKGKYIYIDVWATWCAPCVKQIPYLKKLEEHFKNKDIVFISISVDKKKMKKNWKNYVQKKQLGGVQLFADNSFDSDFMNAYDVSSIPRFILIDIEGNIIDAKAPRPSFQKTKNLLDELLK